MQLHRDDLIEGLRELVRQTHEQGISCVSIRIVGGAALRLAYFQRAKTADIDDDSVSISVAPIDALLAMKLNAARPGRDTGDIAQLLPLNDMKTADEAEDLFGRYYPGDALPNRTLELLCRIFAVGLPAKPVAPQRRQFQLQGTSEP